MVLLLSTWHYDISIFSYQVFSKVQGMPAKDMPLMGGGDLHDGTMMYIPVLQTILTLICSYANACTSMQFAVCLF